MRIFITGGSGLTGPAVISELTAHGHTVTGLARSDTSAARLKALGADVQLGSLDDLDVLTAAARAADGVVHMAYGGDFSDPDAMARRDVAAIDALGNGIAGSDQPLVVTSGTLVMPTGRVTDEDDRPDPESLAHFRILGEQACLRFADRNVRASVVRLAPTVHGPGDYGFVPVLIAAAGPNGVSASGGEGAARWPAVHRLDAARVFRLALERAPAGSAVHGVAENVTLRTIAETIGDTLELPVVSIDLEQAAEHLANPFLARVVATDAPVCSDRTQALLGWTPTQPTLVQDMAAGDYFDPQASVRTEAVWRR